MNKIIKQMEKRIRVLERRKELKSEIDNRSMLVWILMLLLTPITILGYFIASIIYAIYKLGKMSFLDINEMNKYLCKGKFNEFEYMWSCIYKR